LSLSYQVEEYIKYYLRAQTIYSAHSPFVYDFITTVLDTDKNYYAYQTIEKIRSANEADKTEITITDLGAGSHFNNKKVKTVRSIAKSAVSRKWQGRVLFNLMQRYKPDTVLELGTSLGISTLYMALANPNSKIITVEGDANIAEISKENFRRAAVQNVVLEIGNFNDVLEDILANNCPSLSFIDGNHTEESTIQYLDLISALNTTNSIVILDDIHWSPGMGKAWEYAKQHPKYNLTIDLYSFGILFQDERIIEKTHLSIIDKKWKPFSKGVFGMF